MKKILLSLAAVLAVAGAVHAADTPQTDEEKTLYAVGMSIARSLTMFDLSPEELKAVQAGISDGVLKKKPQVDMAEYGPKMQKLAESRTAKAAEGEKKASADFLKKAESEKGAVKTASGLIYTEVAPGKGASPKADSTVKVNYKGTLRDGTVFDSSDSHDGPATLPLKNVIPCWGEALQKMKVGGKAKVVCPSSIAYGDNGAPPVIPPGAALAFDVELLEVQ